MDRIFESWLERQAADAAALAAGSDVLRILRVPDTPPARRFIAEFAAPTMVRTAAGVRRRDGFVVHIQFPPDYLRSAVDAARGVNLLTPANAFHPNVQVPFICLGRYAPGTGLRELLYQVYELLTFQRMTPREDDALNHDACVWARRNMHLFPLTTAPLRRRAAAFSIEAVSPAEEGHEPC